MLPFRLRLRMQIDIFRQFRLDGRVCFLSGASGHLGRHMAEALAAAGAYVLVNARDERKLTALVEYLQNSGGKARAYCFDITKQAALLRAMENIGQEFGRLDVIVNNASSGRTGRWEDIHATDFEHVYRVNVIAAFEVIKAALPLLKKAVAIVGSASVVNIASMYGRVSPDPNIYGDSGANNPPSYGPAKAALIQLTRYAGCELARHGIRVNSISPGPFPDQKYLDKDPVFHARLKAKVPMQRTGIPQEIQGPLLFLASDASSFITGADLAVDGGWTAW